MEDMHALLLFVLRWIHIMAGITWVGHLYFFNLVNVPLQGVLDKDVKPKVNPQLLPRALWWFRWGAMITFLAGLSLLMVKYGHSFEPGQGLWIEGDGSFSVRAKWILFGALLGTIMWFNVWIIIWPAQKQIITWVKDGQSPPEMPVLAKRALLASRTNTYLSGPMLFGMVAASNYQSFSILSLLVVSAIGAGCIYLMIKASYKVGQTV